MGGGRELKHGAEGGKFQSSAVSGRLIWRRSLTGKAADSKSAGSNPLGVRVPPPPLSEYQHPVIANAP
jgi:hypothetical protein